MGSPGEEPQMEGKSRGGAPVGWGVQGEESWMRSLEEEPRMDGESGGGAPDGWGV